MAGGGKRREVVVRDVNGRSVPGAIVEVARGTAPVPEVGHLTDAEGRLWLYLPLGRFILRAATAEGGSGEAEAAGEQDGPIEIWVTETP